MIRKVVSVSNIEPDKDSLLKVCHFGKVEGIEMAGAASYSPVIQNFSYILYCTMEIMVQTDMAMCIAILHEYMGGEDGVSTQSKTPTRDNVKYFPDVAN